MAQHLASSLWQAAASAAGASSGSSQDLTCEGCDYDLDLPDDSAIIMSLLALYPGLRRLEVYTKVGQFLLTAAIVSCACSSAVWLLPLASGYLHTLLLQFVALLVLSMLSQATAAQIVLIAW